MQQENTTYQTIQPNVKDYKADYELLHKQHADLMHDLAKQRIKDYELLRVFTFVGIALPFVSVILSRFNFIVFGVVAVALAGLSLWYLRSTINPVLHYLKEKYK